MRSSWPGWTETDPAETVQFLFIWDTELAGNPDDGLREELAVHLPTVDRGEVALVTFAWGGGQEYTKIMIKSEGAPNER